MKEKQICCISVKKWKDLIKPNQGNSFYEMGIDENMQISEGEDG